MVWCRRVRVENRFAAIHTDSIHTITSVNYLMMNQIHRMTALNQGDHSLGKPGIVRELDSGQGKLKITILQLRERKILPRF